MRRELAHRRFVWSLLRQALRILGLHAMDAGAVVTGSLLAIALGSATPSLALPSVPALTVFVLIGLNLSRSYSAGDARRQTHRLAIGVFIGMLLAALPWTRPQSPVITPQFQVVLGLSVLLMLIVERAVVNAIVHLAYARGIGLRRALIVTRGSEVTPLLTALIPQGSQRPAEDQIITGYVTPEKHDPNALGTLNELGPILDAQGVSEVLVGTSLSDESLSALAVCCFDRGVRLFVVPSVVQSVRGWAEPTRVGRLPAYHLHPVRLELPALMLKRASDLLLAGVGLVVAAPLLVLIAAAIKVESRGPVFFRQRRVGLGGREFMMWKFRSMLNEAESRREDIAHLNAYGDARLFKLRDDPRITRVGRLLRRFSLDELPQLFNIIRGEMSLVGPRPPLPSEVRHYESHHFVRLSVVPGLTGPWQISGRNLITDFEEVVRLERSYIETWSLRTDLLIMLRTGVVVLSGRGAY